MKVLVHYRGAIGDACIWMTKFKGLFQKHMNDELYFVLNSRYDRDATVGLFLHNPFFYRYYADNMDRVIDIAYHMPADLPRVKAMVAGFDLFYDFDVWDTEHKTWYPPVSERYVDLGYDVFPVEITRHERKNTVILHPYGYHIKDTWTKAKWEELASLYKGVAGYEVVFVGETILHIDKLVSLVKTARLWVGVDTGTRNIAMIHRTPAMELGTPGKGDPNFDMFHPKEYRGNTAYFPDINNLSTIQIFKDSMELSKRRG